MSRLMKQIVMMKLMSIIWMIMLMFYRFATDTEIRGFSWNTFVIEIMMMTMMMMIWGC